ncbi:MAG: hypothetical protein ACRERD_05890 [Candidatus Binatia bacterium]
MNQAFLLKVVLLFMLSTGLLLVPAGCERSQPSSQTQKVPADLQTTVDQFVRAFETLDALKVLDFYTDDFISGTGRPKNDIPSVLTQFRSNQVALKVESAEVAEATPAEATLKTRFRLRYKDRFRDLGEGDVVVTDVLMHSLRKDADHWKIYKDERIATYRDGRFGEQPPNVEVEVPAKLPTNLEYPVKVKVRTQKDAIYQVLVGNYVEDVGILPPPDIDRILPEDGVLEANLLPNPQGFSEIVRVTVLVADRAGGGLVGATMVSKFVHGAPRTKSATPKEAT